MKTRSSIEIIGLVLQAVEHGGLTRSKIMYKAMLNFKQVTDYTAFLTEEGLLSYQGDERKYAITDRGRRFLTLFEETNKLLNTYGDMIPNDGEQNLRQQEVALHE